MNVERIVTTAVFICSARVPSLRIPADAKKTKQKKPPFPFLSCHQTREAVTERSSVWWVKSSQVGLFYVVASFLKAVQAV